MTRFHVFAALAAACLLAPPAQGQTSAADDFTFRRVAPPAPGATVRITVQIDPEEQARRLALPPPSASPAPDPSPEQGTIWSALSPAAADGPVTLAAALRAVEAAGTPAPRLALLQRLAERHGADILRETVGARVSPALVLAVMAVESAGRVAAVSPKGAQGLMQLMPATAARFGVSDATDPAQNIRGGVAYLDWLMGRFDGDARLVLAAYNAGEGAVDAHGGVPPFDETRAYVPRVLAAFSVARGLCLTPPDLLSDGCVFRVAAR